MVLCGKGGAPARLPSVKLSPEEEREPRASPLLLQDPTWVRFHGVQSHTEGKLSLLAQENGGGRRFGDAVAVTGAWGSAVLPGQHEDRSPQRGCGTPHPGPAWVPAAVTL